MKKQRMTIEELRELKPGLYNPIILVCDDNYYKDDAKEIRVICCSHNRICYIGMDGISRINNVLSNEFLRHYPSSFVEEFDTPNMEKLAKASEPLIKYLAENYHPHIAAIVDNDSVHIYSGEMGYKTEKFIRD